MSIKKNTFWNLFGSAAPMLVGLFSVPYIYQSIGSERLGVLTIVWALVGYFSIFDFGLGRAITQRIASGSARSAGSRDGVIAKTGVALTLVVGMLGAITVLVSFSLIGISWLNVRPALEQEVFSSLLLASIAIPATTTTTGLRGVLEGKGLFKEINLLKFCLGLSNFLGPVVAILIFGAELPEIVLAIVVVRIVVLIAHYAVVVKWIDLSNSKASKKEATELMRFGGWMTVSNLIAPLMVVADRFIISATLGAAVVSYYTIPAEFLLRILILPAAITSALFPVLSHSLTTNHEEGMRLYRRGLLIIGGTLLPVVSVLLATSGWGIELWLGPEFAKESVNVVLVLAVGILFNGVAQMPHTYIQAAGDSKSTAIVHVAESLIYFPVLLVLLDMFGLVGAAVAWTSRSLLDLLLLHIIALRIGAKYRVNQ